VTRAPERVTVAWRNSVMLVFGISGFALASWLSRVPSVRDELGATTFQMGVLALAISAGSICGFVLAGRVAARFDPQRVIAVALCGTTTGLLLAGIGASAIGSFPLTFVGLLLLGLSNGTCNVTMNVEGVAIERAARRPLMPWFHAVFSIGAVVGASGGALAAALDVPPAWHLAAGALVMAVAGVIAVARRWPTVEPRRVAGERSARAEPPATARPRPVWREPRTLLIGLVVLGMGFANGAANDWVALATADGRGASDGVAALTIDAFTIAIVVARLGGVFVLQRWGRVRTVQVSAAVAVAGMLLFIFGGSVITGFAGAVLWGLGIALAFPIGMSAAGDDQARAAARIAIVAAIGYAGSLVGPPLIGFVAGGSGLLLALLIPLALVVAAGLAAPALRRPR
jgi:MFS family permease